MPKIEECEDGTMIFICPGCDMNHGPRVGHSTGPNWQFNGDLDKPTFTPSILVKGMRQLSYEEHAAVMRGEHVEPTPFVCHSFVTDGKIQFLSDCTHALAGQTVELPEIDL